MATTSDLSQIKVLSQSEFSGLDSTPNDTLHFVEMDNYMFDGQWTVSPLLAINSSGTKSGEQYDLSSYLPSDNYNYLVKFLLAGYDNDSTYGYSIDTDIFITSTQVTSISQQYCHLYGGTYSRQNSIIYDLPVGTGRYFKLWGSAGDNVYVRLLGYRRLGTNT